MTKLNSSYFIIKIFKYMSKVRMVVSIEKGISDLMDRYKEAHKAVKGSASSRSAYIERLQEIGPDRLIAEIESMEDIVALQKKV